MAEATLDTLIIDIQSKGTTGAEAIAKLTSALGSLSKETGNINTGKLSGLTSEVGKFAESAKVADKALPKLASGLGNLARATKNFNGDNLTDFLSKLENIKDIGVNGESIAKMANGLSKIAKTDFSKVDIDKLREVTELLGTLGEKMQGMPSGINIRIDTGGKQATDNGGVAVSPDSQGKRESQEEVVTRARRFEGVRTEPMSFVKSFADTISNFNMTANSLGDSLLRALTTPFDLVGNKIASFTETVLGGLAEKMPVAVGAFNLLGRAIKPVANAFGTLYKKAATAIGSIMKAAAFKALNFLSPVKGLKALGNALDGLKSKLGTVARLGTFMLLRKAFTALIENAKQGIDNLAMYSDAMGTRFNSSMSTLVSDFKWAGNALATAFEPILNVAIPIIDALITRLVAAMTAFANFIAALTGASTFTRAIKINENYAQSLNKGATGAGNAGKAAKKAAKDIKSYTTSIDELNILEPDKGRNSGGSGGSGGGGGVGGLDPTSMFETVETTVKAQNWAQMLRDAWANADFTIVGKAIGTKLKEALDTAHEVFYPKLVSFANRLGKSFATLFNGFIEVDGLGYDIGRALSDALNIAANFVSSFVWNFHFDSLAKFLMDGIEGALDGIDWNRMRSAAIGVGTGIRDFINAAFEDKKVWGKIGTSIGKAINLGLDSAYTILKGIDFSKIGLDIATALNNAVATLNWAKLGEDITEGLNGLMRVVNGFLDTFDFKTFGQKLGECIRSGIQNFDWATLGEGAGNLFSGLVDGLTGLIEGLDLRETAKSLVTGIFTFLKGVDWGEVAKSTVGLLGAVGKGILDLLIGALAGIGEELKGFAGDVWDSIMGGIKKVINNSGAGKLRDSILEAFNIDKNAFNFEAKVKLFRDGWSNIKEWADQHTGGAVSKGIGIFKSGWDKISSFVSGFMGGDVNKGIGLGKGGWSTVGGWIQNYMGNAVSKLIGLSKTWDSVASFVSKHMGGAVTKKVTISAVVTGLTQRLKNFLGLYHGGYYSGGAWKGIPSYASGGMVGVRGAQLFMARETGNPELVGQIGSHPAVLNNGQITSMVSAGVAAAVSQSFAKVAVALYNAFSDLKFVAQPATIEGVSVNTGYSIEDINGLYQTYMAQTQQAQALSMKQAMLDALTEFYATYDNGSEDIVDAIRNKELIVPITDRDIARLNRSGAKKLGAVIMT